MLQMNAVDRRIDQKVRLLLTVQKFAAERERATKPDPRSNQDGPAGERGNGASGRNNQDRDAGESEDEAIRQGKQGGPAGEIDEEPKKDIAPSSCNQLQPQDLAKNEPKTNPILIFETTALSNVRRQPRIVAQALLPVPNAVGFWHTAQGRKTNTVFHEFCGPKAPSDRQECLCHAKAAPGQDGHAGESEDRAIRQGKQEGSDGESDGQQKKDMAPYAFNILIINDLSKNEPKTKPIFPRRSISNLQKRVRLGCRGVGGTTVAIPHRSMAQADLDSTAMFGAGRSTIAQHSPASECG
jgi:hypothetical protein